MSSPVESTKQITPWWGNFQITPGACRKLDFGAKSFIFYNLGNEWRIQEEPQQQSDAEKPFRATCRQLRTPPPENKELQRFAFSGDSNTIAITPYNANRSVIAHPSSPITIPPGKQAQFYVSSPLWLRFEVAEPKVLLTDIPVFRPSDIWFGDNTRVGTLCYSSRTGAHTSVQQLRLRSHRIFTALHVHNMDSTPFVLEKINIPAPHLSLFATEDAILWTENISVTLEGDGKNATLKIEGRPENIVQDVSLPREEKTSSSLIASIGDWLK